jgi:hypothetical protein
MLRRVPVAHVCVSDLALRGLAQIIAGHVQAPGVADSAEAPRPLAHTDSVSLDQSAAVREARD